MLEISVTDVASHTETGVIAYRDQLALETQARIGRFNAEAQKEVARAVQQIRKTSSPLFLQAILTMDVLERVLEHITLYFAQRRPKELASFKWIVDSKEKSKTTNWEMWWSTYCRGVLAMRSKSRPAAALEGADYSYFEASYGGSEGGEEEPT